MRNIFIKTLWDYRRSLIFWTIGIVLTLLMYSSLFPSISGSMNIADAFKNLPEGFSALVGDVSRMSTAPGYITSEYLSMTYPLILAILGISVGSALLAREEESGTIELLLTSKLNRGQILRHKLAALYVMLTVIGAAGWIGITLGNVFFHMDIDLIKFAVAMLTGVLLGAVYGTLAFTLTAITPRRGLSVGISSLVFLGTYILFTVSKIVDFLEPWSKLSPLHYYNGTELLYSPTNWSNLAILTAISLVLVVVAHLSFDRRDIG